MFATLFVGGLIKLTASGLAATTGSLVKMKRLRGMKKDAKRNGGQLNVVELPLILNDREIKTLAGNPVWAKGRMQAKLMAKGAA
jgi:hypothetical protein